MAGPVEEREVRVAVQLRVATGHWRPLLRSDGRRRKLRLCGDGQQSRRRHPGPITLPNTCSICPDGRRLAQKRKRVAPPGSAVPKA
jgi:hypothetical protein